MRLKRLEIQGYKSFAQRTEFLFDQGVTAIVGPNGSGKSNVADALRWVLGETNVRHLRGKKSEDLIFAGADGRSQVGMAQVMLTLDNSGGWFRPLPDTKPLRLDKAASSPPKLVDALLAAAPAEVVITRRLYRDGDVEWSINGQRARLADVSHLLAAGGIAGDTYTVIGQGLVDQALALRPEDRRVMLDEAAGIKPLQSQRDRALARLDETRANLLRVNDILSELTPQLRRLERLAVRAEEHRRLSAELEGLLVQWYGHQWHAAQAAAQAAELAVVKRQHEADARDAEVQSVVGEIAAARVERERRRAEVDGLRRQAGRLRDTAETVGRDLAVADERVIQLAARHREAAAEADSLTEAAQESAAQLQAAETEAATATAEAQAAALALRTLQRAMDEAQAERQRHAAAIEAARAAVNRAVKAVSDRKARSAGLVERQGELERAVAEAMATHAEHAERSREARARLGAAEAQLVAAEQSVGEAETALRALRDVLRTNQATLDAALETVEAARARQREVEHRRAVLAELRHAQLGRAAQRIVDNRSLRGMICPLSQALRVPPGLEIAVAAALGPTLHALVMANWEAAQEAAASIQDEDAGSVTFFAADDAPVRASAPSVNLDWLANHVDAEYRLSPVVRAALQDIALAPDIAAARALITEWATTLPCLRVVTPNGWVLEARGSLTVGGVSGATALSYEHEWASLPDPGDLAAAVAVAQDGVTAARIQVEQAQARATDAEKALAERRTVRDEQRGQTSSAEASLERAATAEAFHTRALQRQRDDLTRVTQQATAQADDLGQASAALAEAEARLAALVARPVPDSVELQARLGEAQAVAVTAAQTQRMQSGLVEQRRAAHSHTERQAQERARRVHALTAETEAVTRRTAELRAESERVAGERRQVRARLEPTEAALATVETALRGLEDAVTARRDAALAAERALAQAHSAAREAGDRVRRLAADIEADLDLLPRAADGVAQQLRLAFEGQAELPAVAHLPIGLEDQMRQLKGQLRRLGSPDADALAEYATLQERHAFLSSQVADLEQAAADLRAIVIELDAAMESRFSEVFEQVAQRFSRNFTVLFGGGSARMVMLDGGGLEITARPPGKRPQPLSLLSGGERALTASALIFALLDVSGTPFCLLDEVDAALDEANVGRFRAALERLAQQTQVIIVTHNRGTVEAADAVYGITMGGNGISQAISLRLRDRAAEARDVAAAD